MWALPMFAGKSRLFTRNVPLKTFSRLAGLQMSFHLYFFDILFRSGAPLMTLLTAGALTDPQLPATASHVCTTDPRLGGVGRVVP